MSEKIKVERWHAYLMDDGEIFICEYLSPEKVIWSSTVSDNLLQTKSCKVINAFDLGYVGSS